MRELCAAAAAATRVCYSLAPYKLFYGHLHGAQSIRQLSVIYFDHFLAVNYGQIHNKNEKQLQPIESIVD